MEPGSTERPRVAAARRWLAGVLLGMLFGAGAAAVEPAPVLSSPIPSQPLAAALAEFAHQTRLQLVYVTTIVRARTSRDVSAGLGPGDALSRLLDGTGLSFEFLNARTVRIFGAAATASAAPPKAGDAPGPRGASSFDSTHAVKDTGVLDDVIVTSQLRSEHVSTVPISISVVSAADLSRGHMTSIPDLSRSVPNVSFTTQGGPGLNTLEIRGVSSLAGTAAIGVYQDDVSLTTRNLYSQGIAEPRFFDLDRVEVLRGPQGTLYGGGTLGGVVRFITRQPDLREFDATAAAESSETQHGGVNYNSEGVLNLPLIDGRLALRLGAQQGHDSGYIDQVSPTDLSIIAKGINGNRWTVARAALKWQVADAWFATPAVFYQRFSSDDIDAFFPAVLSDQAAAGQPLQPFQTSKTVREPGTDRITIPSLTIEGNVGVADLTLVGSLYRRDFDRNMDGTLANVQGLATLFPPGSAPANGIAALNSVIYLSTRQAQKSFEARLASTPYSGNGAALSWIAGAFYLSSVTDLYDDEPVIGITRLFNQIGLNINDPAVFPGSFPGAWPAGDSSLYNHRYYNPSQRAVFGEVSYYIQPAIRLTLGLRYESAKDTFEHDGNYVLHRLRASRRARQYARVPDPRRAPRPVLQCHDAAPCRDLGGGRIKAPVRECHQRLPRRGLQPAAAGPLRDPERPADSRLLRRYARRLRRGRADRLQAGFPVELRARRQIPVPRRSAVSGRRRVRSQMERYAAERRSPADGGRLRLERRPRYVLRRGSGAEGTPGAGSVGDVCRWLQSRVIYGRRTRTGQQWRLAVRREGQRGPGSSEVQCVRGR